MHIQGGPSFCRWHGYLALSFVHNSNRVVANPAPLFFSVPVVASTDLEIPGISPPLNDPDQRALASLVAAGGSIEWAPALTTRNFKYVLLAKELDWTSYGYLARQAHLDLVGDYGSILLYENVLWH